MKKMLKLIAAALAAITALSCASVAAFADKLKTVDGVTYRYSDSGEVKGKYTGWAKTSKGRVYYKNGVKLKKCWLKVNGKRAYYLKSNGLMAVGDVEFKNGRTYHFEADGKLGRAPLIFAAVETNNAWVFYQKVTVVDSAGNIYWSGVYEDRSKEITLMMPRNTVASTTRFMNTMTAMTAVLRQYMASIKIQTGKQNLLKYANMVIYMSV